MASMTFFLTFLGISQIQFLFSSVHQFINSSVLPESYPKNYPDINFEFGLCSPEEIVEINKSLEKRKKNCGH